MVSAELAQCVSLPCCSARLGGVGGFRLPALVRHSIPAHDHRAAGSVRAFLRRGVLAVGAGAGLRNPQCGGASRGKPFSFFQAYPKEKANSPGLGFFMAFARSGCWYLPNIPLGLWN